MNSGLNVDDPTVEVADPDGGGSLDIGAATSGGA